MARLHVTDDHIHQSNLIEGFNSEEADQALRTAWERLLDATNVNVTAGSTPLDGDTVCFVHTLATWHQGDLQSRHRGAWRDVLVSVGGRLCPEPEDVPDLMGSWLDRYAAGAEDPVAAHVEFEHIHPFVDGNGRVGRLLLWWHELVAGAPATLIRYEDRFDYYSWF